MQVMPYGVQYGTVLYNTGNIRTVRHRKLLKYWYSISC